MRIFMIVGGFFIMNRTLFDCGFQQKVELRNGDLLDVTATLPKAVKLKYDSVRCGSMFTSAAQDKQHVV